MTAHPPSSASPTTPGARGPGARCRTRGSALSLATAAIVTVARRPLGVVLCAMMFLVGQLAARAGLAQLLGDLVESVLAGRPLPPASLVGAGLGLSVGGLFAACGLLTAFLTTPDDDPGGPWSALGGLAAAPAAFAVWLVALATAAALVILAAVGLARIAGMPPGQALVPRALAAALLLAPALLALMAVVMSALLASAWLATGDAAAQTFADGLRTLGLALQELIDDPPRATAVWTSLSLVCLPLHLLAIATTPCWIVRLPAGTLIHLVHCLALAAWWLTLGVGLRQAFPHPRP